MATFDDESSYDVSYIEEVIELSEDDDDDDDEEDEDDYDVEIITEKNRQRLQAKQEKESQQVLEEEEYSVVEEYFEEILVDHYEVPLAGDDDESTYDDDSTAYDPDQPIPSQEEFKRKSASSDLEIAKYSDHSMDTDNAFELSLPNVPKSRQMSALTLDWDAYQDSTNSWGAFGSDEGSSEQNEDLWGGGEELSAGTPTGPIISINKGSPGIQGDTPANETQKGVRRIQHNGNFSNRGPIQRTQSGSGFPSRGALTRNHSGGLRNGISRTNSGGLIRPPVPLLSSPGNSRRRTHSHLIPLPLDTLKEDREEHMCQHSPVGNSEQGKKVSLETLTTADPSFVPPPAPQTDSDSDVESTGDYHDQYIPLKGAVITSSPVSTGQRKNEQQKSNVLDLTDDTESRIVEEFVMEQPCNDRTIVKQREDMEVGQGLRPAHDEFRQKIETNATNSQITSTSPKYLAMGTISLSSTCNNERHVDPNPKQCTSDTILDIFNEGDAALHSTDTIDITASNNHDSPPTSSPCPTPDQSNPMSSSQGHKTLTVPVPMVMGREWRPDIMPEATCPRGTHSQQSDTGDSHNMATHPVLDVASSNRTKKDIAAQHKPPIQPTSLKQMESLTPIQRKSSTTTGNKTPRSIDQLRRSIHGQFSDGIYHSQSSQQRRMSDREKDRTRRMNNGSDGNLITSKPPKVSSFQQLLERSTAIKAVR